jgi:diguanylate cyclase (GGDEF)-like protein
MKVAVFEADPVIAGFYSETLRTNVREAEVSVVNFEDPRLAEVLTSADVCICSTGPGPDTGFDTLVRLLLIRPDLPVVILLPACAASSLEAALQAGAADVLIRTNGYLDQLPVTVRKVVLHVRGIGYADARHRALHNALAGIQAENRTLQALIERLESLAMTDPLTGLLNRRALDASLVRSFARSHRYGHELSCLVLDVDRFKGVNDTLGHARGDELLKLLASVIIAECRQSDVAARSGGDEFVVLLPHTGPAEAASVAQRLRRRFDREAMAICQAAGFSGDIGLSIGVASRAALAAATPAELLAAADAALYDVKRSGRDAVKVAMARSNQPVLRRVG